MNSNLDLELSEVEEPSLDFDDLGNREQEIVIDLEEEEKKDNHAAS